MPSRTYLLSLPERVIRSALAFSAGLLREIGEVVVPRAVRRGQLYRSLVDVTLRYVIEQVGGAKGVYPWLSSSTRVAAKRTGKLLSAALLDDYGLTLNELREVGYVTYARRQLSP
jgi:hypothetical protein